MRKLAFIVFASLVSKTLFSQVSRFERSGGLESATYFEAVEWYKNLAKRSKMMQVREMGMTDAGYPLHLVLVSADGKFDPAVWHKQNKIVIMINNGIHPGEPDGIDASMMMVRDMIDHKSIFPANVVLGIIPVYNIGGCLNRNSYTRANQNGPLEYGFRGNAENLDLNRDFTKCDSKDARAFAQIFHLLDPNILIDNHVSDGADYQYTMTLISTQYDKLGKALGGYLKNVFEPKLYAEMAEKNMEMTPYVDFSVSGPDKGMEMFYDPPRYSTGYAALFNTISFMPETHMLKPFKDRVNATYALMQTMIDCASKNSKELINARISSSMELSAAKTLPLSWSVDSTQSTEIMFKGYEQSYKTSEATGLQQMFYDHAKPFSKRVPYFNVFKPLNVTTVPKAYIIPQGWWNVIELLKLNGVVMQPLGKDTTIEVEAYHIDDYKASPRAYEKHHRNGSTKVSVMKQRIKFLKGDYLIPIEKNWALKRYLVEMLEPTGDDSFFSWNFFDAILQQKEGYSDYRWEDIAAGVLKKDPALQKKLQEKKAADPKFAGNSSAILSFIYQNSPYYEPAHLRYPVYRVKIQSGPEPINTVHGEPSMGN